MGYVLLCPNLAGLELAPTTAKCGEDIKARAVASVAILSTQLTSSYLSFSASG